MQKQISNMGYSSCFVERKNYLVWRLCPVEAKTCNQHNKTFTKDVENNTTLQQEIFINNNNNKKKQKRTKKKQIHEYNIGVRVVVAHR